MVPDSLRGIFDTKTHYWEQAGLARQVQAKEAKKARRNIFLTLPLFAAVLIAYEQREHFDGSIGDTPIRIATALALVILGWAVARDFGKAIGPALFKRMDPATAGTVGFLIRLLTIVIVVLLALNVAGIDARTLTLGASFTAVVVGLAAQQTLGNLIAGMVLLSARPFTVGDRVRLQGGGVAGTLEGVVSSLGLLYTTFAEGEDRIQVPNSVLLSLAVVPLREPDSVDLRARIPATVLPSDVQRILRESVQVATREEPHISLEELDGDVVVVRITATPERSADGSRLADEILSAVSQAAQAAQPVAERFST